MELSNKTMIYMISIAIIIILFGTTISLTRLQQIYSITGLASSTSGAVNVTVAATASINLTYNSINWGSGQVASGSSSATLDTNNNSAYVQGGTWSTSGINGFTLENDGNVPVNVTINNTHNATTLINGTNPQFRFEARIPTGNSTACESGLLTGQTEFAQTSIKRRICNTLNYTQNRDKLIIDINITIPEDSPTGSKNSTVTFDACSVASGTCTP